MSGQTTLGDTMRREAEISPCGLHRYRLTREWAPTLPTIAFVMLNPSTADGEIDDPTIRRCIGFARDLGYGRLHVVNLFTYRATDPREVWPSLLARPSRRWRSTRWAPNGRRVGAQEQGHRDRGYVVAKTRRQTERRLTVVVARRGGAPEVLEAI